MEREDDYDGGGYGGMGDNEMQDDMMDHDGGNREDLDQQEAEGIEGAADRTELLADAPAQPIDKSKRITTRYMTKYERARVLGTRALQIRYA